MVAMTLVDRLINPGDKSLGWMTFSDAQAWVGWLLPNVQGHSEAEESIIEQAIGDYDPEAWESIKSATSQDAISEKLQPYIAEIMDDPSKKMSCLLMVGTKTALEDKAALENFREQANFLSTANKAAKVLENLLDVACKKAILPPEYPDVQVDDSVEIIDNSKEMYGATQWSIAARARNTMSPN